MQRMISIVLITLAVSASMLAQGGRRGAPPPPPPPLQPGASQADVDKALIAAFAASPPAQRDAVVENPVLSPVESVKYLGTFIDVLTKLHGMQGQLDGMKTDDYVGRMTRLRVMAAEADVAAMTLEPFAHSKNDNISKSAGTAAEVFGFYKGIYGQNVGLYEQLVRVFTIPHELSESETKVIAESRITASQIAAQYTQASELLKDAAMLAFAAAIVAALMTQTILPWIYVCRPKDRFRYEAQPGL